MRIRFFFSGYWLQARSTNQFSHFFNHVLFCSSFYSWKYNNNLIIYPKLGRFSDLKNPILFLLSSDSDCSLILLWFLYDFFYFSSSQSPLLTKFSIILIYFFTSLYYANNEIHRWWIDEFTTNYVQFFRFLELEMKQ